MLLHSHVFISPEHRLLYKDDFLFLKRKKTSRGLNSFPNKYQRAGNNERKPLSWQLNFKPVLSFIGASTRLDHKVELLH